ncbi:hypothetical protein [Kitasatospora sp. NPDC101183]|uniref:hypothetical protein n=1 Tax=Kitasatospora sp. NPDC101183 TaxID=3364100 RepID=UPI0037F17ECE
MPIRTLTFHIVTCDICGDEDTDDRVLPLYETPQIAADNARQCGWIVTTDQHVICPATDDHHRAAIDALMPPSCRPNPPSRSTDSSPSTSTPPPDHPPPHRAPRRTAPMTNATPAENIRAFLAANPLMVTVRRLATCEGDHTLTVADLVTLMHASATKAQERAVTAFLDAHDAIGDDCPVVSAQGGARLLAADVRELLADLDPDRLDGDDVIDVIDVEIEWPEGAEEFRITRRRLGELLALAEQYTEIDD